MAKRKISDIFKMTCSSFTFIIQSNGFHYSHKILIFVLCLLGACGGEALGGGGGGGGVVP